ncbi:hypothetical protein ABPG75_002486 [Micractinium tetrahymenae]
MWPSEASQQLAEPPGGPPSATDELPPRAGHPPAAGAGGAAPSDGSHAASRPAAQPALLPCGLTAEELASLTSQVEARSGSGALDSDDSSSEDGSGVVAPDQPSWPLGPAAHSAAARLAAAPVPGQAAAAEGLSGEPWAELEGTDDRRRHSFDQVNRVAATPAEEPWAQVAGRDSRGRRSFDQVNRVAAAVAAEKARRRSLQRQLQTAAAARPRSHAALHKLPQHAAPTSPDLARAQLPLLGRQRSASEGQLEALLGSGRQVLAPAPATPRSAAEGLTVAQRLAALSPGPASELAAPTAAAAVGPAARGADPGPGSAAQPETVPVLRSSAPPEAPALRQLRTTTAAGSVSINGRGSSPRVHLRDPQLPASPLAVPGAAAGAAAAVGPQGEQEAPPPFPTDPGLGAWFAASGNVTAPQPAASPGNSTRIAGVGHGGRLPQPGAAPDLPSRLHIHAAAFPPFPLDEADGKSAAPHAARASPNSPGTPTARRLAQEGASEGPGTPRRRAGLLSAAARLFRS